MLTPREKSPLPKMSPEEDRTCDTVDSEPKHYQLSYSGPPIIIITVGKDTCSSHSSQHIRGCYLRARPPHWPSGKASASRAEDPGFESRLR